MSKKEDRTLKRAKEARKLFIKGLIAEEIAEKMRKSKPTIWRYFQSTGKLTNEEKAKHAYNRFVRNKNKKPV